MPGGSDRQVRRTVHVGQELARPGEINAAFSEYLVPITRDHSRYLEPGAHAVKRKNRKLAPSMGVTGTGFIIRSHGSMSLHGMDQLAGVISGTTIGVARREP
jgi:hypothetical protein